MNGYGVLRNQAGDAGAWQLLEEVEPGEWVAVARGKAADMQKLAGRLGAATVAVSAADYRAANLDAVREQLQPAEYKDPRHWISLPEVERWNREEYEARRAQLWTESKPGAATDYYDGAGGRRYTGSAALLMTGRKTDHPAYRQQPLARLIRAAEPVLREWSEASSSKRALAIEYNWPDLAAALLALDTAVTEAMDHV